MTHADFVSGYNDRRLSAQVDYDGALKLMSSALAFKQYRYAMAIWQTVWVLCFPAAIICFIWVHWWAGLACLLVSAGLYKAINKSATEFVVEQALEDATYFDKCVQLGILRIVERQQRELPSR